MGTDELESLYAQSAKAPFEVATALGSNLDLLRFLAAVDMVLGFRNVCEQLGSEHCEEVHHQQLVVFLKGEGPTIKLLGATPTRCVRQTR